MCEVPTKTKPARHGIRHYIPELLNKTEPCIIDKIHSNSYDAFSNYAKKKMINGYKENCETVNHYICNN